jgi:hypothetical protein
MSRIMAYREICNGGMPAFLVSISGQDELARRP